MLRMSRISALLLLAASAFDSSPGGSQPDSNAQNFDPNVHPEQQPATASSGFPTSTSTGKGEKSYQEAIGQQEQNEPQAGNQAGPATGPEPHPQNDAATTELPQTPFDPDAPLGRDSFGNKIVD